jgi:hypothetical protein
LIFLSEFKNALPFFFSVLRIIPRALNLFHCFFNEYKMVEFCFLFHIDTVKY